MQNSYKLEKIKRSRPLKSKWEKREKKVGHHTNKENKRDFSLDELYPIF